MKRARSGGVLRRGGRWRGVVRRSHEMALPNVRGNRTGIVRPGAIQLLERLQHLVLADLEQARVGVGSRAVSPVRPAHRTRWIGRLRRAVPSARATSGRRARRTVCRARSPGARRPVSPHTTPARDGDRRRQLAQDVRPASTAASSSPAVAAIHRARTRSSGAARDDHPSPGVALGGDHARPALRRPAARRATPPGMDDRGAAAARRGRRRRERRCEVAPDRRGCRPTPAAGTSARPRARPRRQAGPSRPSQANAISRRGRRSREQRRGSAGPRPCRLTATARAARPRRERAARCGHAVRRGPASRAAPRRRERRGAAARARASGNAPRERAQRGDRGEQVAQPEGAQDDEAASRPGRAPRDGVIDELAQLDAGRLAEREDDGLGDVGRVVELRVGAGLVLLRRARRRSACACRRARASSRRPVAGQSRSASARVKPTTPNLLAQYAVASPERAQAERRGDGDDAPAGGLERRQRRADDRRGAEQVDGDHALPVPPRRRRRVAAGVGAGRGHDAVQPAVLLDHAARRRRSARGAGGEVDDLVREAVAGCAAVEHDRRPAGAARRRPRRRRRGPDAPPVTRTVPSSASARVGGLLDQSGRRAARHVRHEHDAPAPLGERLRLGRSATA